MCSCQGCLEQEKILMECERWEELRLVEDARILGHQGDIKWGVCSSQSSVCTWNTVSLRGQDPDFVGQRSLVATKDQMQSLKQSLLPEKITEDGCGFHGFQENFKSISRKVRIIESPKYCEKETGGHLVKKGCSGHVGTVGSRKRRSVCVQHLDQLYQVRRLSLHHRHKNI